MRLLCVLLLVAHGFAAQVCYDPLVIDGKTVIEGYCEEVADNLMPSEHGKATQQEQQQIDALPTNPTYSYQSWKRQKFTNAPAEKFSGSVVRGACFYQDAPYSRVFPDDIRDVFFVSCNLDNCIIPAGAQVVGGTNTQIMRENDGEYWIVGPDLKPLIPRDTAAYSRCGLSINPASIPAQPLDEPVTVTYDPARIERQKIEALKSDEARLRQILIDAGEIQP